jgi:hypothetical protein
MPKRPQVPTVASMQAPAVKGVGNAFLDQRLTPQGSRRSADFGGQGLPRAPQPMVLPERGARQSDIDARAREKRMANRRRTAANITAGYVSPGPPTNDVLAAIKPLPTAEQLLMMDEEPQVPTAAELIRDQLYRPSDDANLGRLYTFPQVAPTKTINPMRPRTLEAGYEKDTFGKGLGTLRVRFRDGTPWEYYKVPPNIWQNFKRSVSPGRFINRVLNGYPYGEGNF